MNRQQLEYLEMVQRSIQPTCLHYLKQESKVRGEFVGYDNLDLGSTTHHGSGRKVYTVLHTHLVKTRTQAQNYREWLRWQPTELDRLIQYAEDLEEIIRKLTMENKDEQSSSTSP